MPLGQRPHAAEDRLDVELSELTAGGLKEPKADWTSQAKQYLTHIGMVVDRPSFEMFFMALAKASQLAGRHLVRNASGD